MIAQGNGSASPLSCAAICAAWKRRDPATISNVSVLPPSTLLGTGPGRTKSGTSTPRARIEGRMSDKSGALLPYRIFALLTEGLPRSLDRKGVGEGRRASVRVYLGGIHVLKT